MRHVQLCARSTIAENVTVLGWSSLPCLALHFIGTLYETVVSILWPNQGKGWWPLKNMVTTEKASSRWCWAHIWTKWRRELSDFLGKMFSQKSKQVPRLWGQQRGWCAQGLGGRNVLEQGEIQGTCVRLVSLCHSVILGQSGLSFIQL